MKKKATISDPIMLHGNCLFVSDAHFRTPPDAASEERELKLVQLLKSQEGRLQHLFLLGDIFDYWFEYRDVVPKGYFTLFACLKELHLQGVQIHYFTGNHDMWVEDYFTQMFGAVIYREARLFDINGHRCFVGHGDGLGGKQHKYLMIKLTFTCKNSRIPAEEDKHGGVGLKNVKQRLDLIYGDRYNLDIKDEPDKYYVILTLPL